MERIVKLKMPNQVDSRVVTSGARTFGELKDDIAELSNGNLRFVTKDSRVTLEDDQAKLPEGDFTIVAFATQIKAGNIVPVGA